MALPPNLKKFEFKSKVASSAAKSNPKKQVLKGKIAKMRKAEMMKNETPAEQKSKGEEMDGQGGYGKKAC
jgi:hypothetical protein